MGEYPHPTKKSLIKMDKYYLIRYCLQNTYYDSGWRYFG